MRVGDLVTIVAKSSVYNGCHGRITLQKDGGFVVVFKKRNPDRFEKAPEHELLFMENELQKQNAEVNK